MQGDGKKSTNYKHCNQITTISPVSQKCASDTDFFYVSQKSLSRQHSPLNHNHLASSYQYIVKGVLKYGRKEMVKINKEHAL